MPISYFVDGDDDTDTNTVTDTGTNIVTNTDIVTCKNGYKYADNDADMAIMP